MVSREQLDALRSLAKARHKAATRKVSRLKKSDVEISGTKLDPRRDLGNLKRYNRKQLESYISSLDQFVSRETSYTVGAKGRIIDANKVNRLKRLESQVNKQTQAFYNQIKDKFIPSLGGTVEQAEGKKPTHQTTGNPASRSPHIPLDRSPKGIPNNKQLDKLLAHTEKKVGKGYTNEQLAQERKIALKMLVDIGKITPGFKIDGKRVTLASMRKQIREMSAEQFNFLWNYNNLAAVASFDYEIAKSKLADRKALAQFDTAFDTQLRVMHQKIGEAKSLDL